MDLNSKEFRIGKLSRSNYQVWKFKIEMILSKDDLWDIVTQDTPLKPSDEWLKKDRLAKATISLNVEDFQLTHIRRCKHANQMWSELKKVHQKAELSNKLFLLHQLYGSKLQPDGDMEAHLNGILDLTDKLRDIGEIIKDDHITALMLCSLPKDYDTLITALEARPEKELNLDYVKGKLIHEFNKKDHKEDLEYKDRFESSGLKTTVKDTSKKESKTCLYCNKPGHIRKFCRKMKRDKLKSQDKPDTTSNGYNNNNDHHHQKDKNNPKSEHTKSATSNRILHESDRDWYLDSGASTHMSSNKDSFHEIKIRPMSATITMANGSNISAEGIGKVILKCSTESGINDLLIKDVLYAPELKGNLLSVGKLIEDGYDIHFKDGEASIGQNGRIIAKALQECYIYKIHIEEKALLINATPTTCIHHWHRRLGHRDTQAIIKLCTDKLATGIVINQCTCEYTCIECIECKTARKPFPRKSLNRAERPFQLIHTDVCGPIHPTTPAGNKYYVTFIDDFSRYTEVQPIKSKDQVKVELIKFIEAGKNKFNRRPETVRCDNGGEYLNHDIESYLSKEGIHMQTTVPYTPQQNGTAERKNRSLTEMTRCLISDAKISQKYWGEAVCTACYLQNRLPTSVDKTPFELWHGKPPNLKHIRIFGSQAYYHIPKEKHGKLDNTTKSGILVGYSSASKGYRILLPESNKILISRDVIFLENQENKSIQINDDEAEDENLEDVPGNRKSTRVNFGKPPSRYGLNSNLSSDDYKCYIEPSSFKQTQNLSIKDKEIWRKAMDEEMDSLTENQTWDLQTLPIGRKTVDCKWTYKIKRNAIGEPSQYKARLIAKGFTQKFGEDYDAIFDPVVKYTTLRILLTIAGHKKMLTRHLDVKSAFLHGELKEEIYMKQPEGYIEQGKENLVCRLKKCLYGLKQSAREWNIKINTVLVAESYKRSTADPCLYTKTVGGNSTYVLLYVDDLLICSDSPIDLKKTQEILAQNFKMKDLGEVAFYLGIQIEKNPDFSFSIHQKNKILNLLEQFKMTEAKGNSTPMTTDFLKHKGDISNLSDQQNLFRQGVGSLLYLATTTRPDIAAATGFLGRRVSQPSNADWKALKRVLSYLKSTANLKLKLEGNKEMKLCAYADADWAGDSHDRKSTSGMTCTLGKSSITWGSKKQSCVALSSTEAEYISAASTGQEVKWLRLLLDDLGYTQESPTPLFEDNQSCIKLASSEKINARTKHIDVRFHLIKDYLKQGIIELSYCLTEAMIADIFTKPLAKDKFTEFRTDLGLVI